MIKDTLQTIKKDFFISNYKLNAANRNQKLNNALFELNMKRKDANLELVEEDGSEYDTDVKNSPKRRVVGYSLDNRFGTGVGEEKNPLEKKIIPSMDITT